MNLTLGPGKVVHLAHVTIDGETTSRPECGGNRASERYRTTTREVTCKNCIKWMAAEVIEIPEAQPVETAETKDPGYVAPAEVAQAQSVEPVVQVQDSFVIRTEDATLAQRIMTLLEGSDRFNYPQILLEAIRQEAQAELDRQQADPEPPIEVIAMQHNEHVAQVRCGDDDAWAVSTNGVWRIPGSGIAGCDLDDVLRAWAIRLGHLGDVAIVRKS
jgi:hypothetical protein